jgi:hypothetical protein
MNAFSVHWRQSCYGKASIAMPFEGIQNLIIPLYKTFEVLHLGSIGKNTVPIKPEQGIVLAVLIKVMQAECQSGQSLSGSPVDRMISSFFDAEGLQRMLTFLCNSRLPGSWDPVTSTVVDMLTLRLQFCLTADGLAPFRGKPDMVYPYHMMTMQQKTFLREELAVRSSYCICNDALVFHPTVCAPERLDQVTVLEGVCNRILASGVHAEHRVRIGVCNIILQRVQGVVPISRGVQQKLNAVLFGSVKVSD